MHSYMYDSHVHVEPLLAYSAGTCHCALCIDKPNCPADPHHMMGVLQEDAAHELERAASKAEQAVELQKAAELHRVCL